MKNSETQRHRRYKVLFLASWYPSRVARVTGIFIKRKAECMTALCDVAVLHVAADASLIHPYEITTSVENSVLTVIVYFKPSANALIAGFVYNIRFISAHIKGWFTVKNSFGVPDILHINVIDRAGYIGYLLSKLKHIPYVITEHSTPDIAFLRGEKSHPDISLRSLKSVVIAAADAMNVDSQASLQFYKKAGFIGNLSVIPNVVEVLPRFINNHQNKRTGKIIAVHISVLVERKNVRDIITVVSQLYKEGYSNLEFHILGSGVQLIELTELAASLGTLDKAIFFHGYISDEEKMKILSSADMHILNSDEEGFSIVTAEAIACGVPVIATRCGGPEDFVTEETGILIDRRSPGQLRQAILKLIESRDRYKPEAMHAFASERFSRKAVAEKTFAMYSGAIRHWKAGNTGYRVTIDPQWNVLDVGSGHQPHRRADVLLERFLEPTIHRTNQNVPIPSDQQMVVGDGLSMPFKDKSFDFAVASHIAEHVDDPLKFCRELQRVSKRGYLETPGPLTEWLMPTASHKWIITKKMGVVTFRKNPYKASAFPLFFRFFYLNRDGYVPNTLHAKNFILKLINAVLLKLWIYLPFSYVKLHWNDNFTCRVAE